MTRHRAQDRARPPGRALRGRDLQRGRRARALRDRRPARRRRVSDPEAALLSRGARSRASRALREVIDLLAADQRAPTTVRDPHEAWRTHVLDSLSGLEVPELRDAAAHRRRRRRRRLPGHRARRGAARTRTSTWSRRPRASASSCASLLERDAHRQRRVVCARAEEWGAARPPDGGREAADVVTARAVGRLSTLAELASPLLREGGTLVAWKGRRDPDEEAEAGRAAERLAMEPRRGARRDGPERRRLRAPPPLRLHQGRPDARRASRAAPGWRRSAPSAASSDPAPPAPRLSSRRDGPRLRDRQPEGRGGEDHHRRQHRRLRRRAAATRCCSSTSTSSATPPSRSAATARRGPPRTTA